DSSAHLHENKKEKWLTNRTSQPRCARRLSLSVRQNNCAMCNALTLYIKHVFIWTIIVILQAAICMSETVRSIPADNPFSAFIFGYILAPGMWIVTGLSWNVYWMSLVAVIVFPLILGIVSVIIHLFVRYRKHFLHGLCVTL
ncbi:MAG: hypothetical protein EBY32_17875, partial [Proteobacteria bacterium]|nr:hypothetical protein [Pseudomonadota bacterium]